MKLCRPQMLAALGVLPALAVLATTGCDVLNASDRLHPSDAGYRLWYGELNTQAGLSARLAALRR